MKMNIAVIDDEMLVREGLKIILSSYADIDVVEVGADGFEAVEICREHDIDLVLMDVRMPHCDGVEGTKLIKDSFPAVKVLILTTFKDIEYIQKALENGASGYLLKDSPDDLLYEAIKAAISGNIVIHPDIVGSILHPVKEGDSGADVRQRYDLTERECRIIELIAQGFSNREIGGLLHLSEGTVKNYLSTVFAKLDLRDRTQLAAFAYKNNLVKQ